ncbi:unnamed protein product [Enterobius vermicularis]|uniref:Histone-lysine N-methyltransferase n=1 Tax=Enterobius vermicularis TaxID=51028 RepID=A0A0N4VDC4_ENTVE|nr:unnamed protein product [Enterobius vermicularis]
MARRNDGEVSTGKCMNNFLRNYRRQREEELMEEKITPYKGFGVFAKKNISKGTDLAEYLGVVVPKDDYLEKLKLRANHHNLEMCYFGIQLTPQYYLDARNFGGMARTINHSCDPNCQVAVVTVDGVYRLKIISIKDILKGAIFLEPVLKSFYLKRIRAKKLTLGEEITFDYDSELQEGLVGTKCRCGSNNCRGFIGKKVNGSTRSRYTDQNHEIALKGRKEGEQGENKENMFPVGTKPCKINGITKRGHTECDDKENVYATRVAVCKTLSTFEKKASVCSGTEVVLEYAAWKA